MKEAKTYPEGTPFPGKIGRTIAASESAWPQPPRAKPGSPNILVVLFDDVGFAHLGCFGSDINTPNINRLATGGLRYRDFHTTAICAPTRVRPGATAPRPAACACCPAMAMTSR